MSVEIIKQATGAQVLAARPDHSSWVSANAGSGKTRVLTNRVSRLLLRGTDPAKILCLTFTTAAAAEMQNRLFDQLGEWAMLPDKDLQQALIDLGEPAPSGAALIAARTLFARALETPGGLKIQTIHAFCESLLHRFPLEARISPDFELMDDRQITSLRSEVLNDIAQNQQDIFDSIIASQAKDPADYLPDILKHQECFETGFDSAEMAGLLGAEPEITDEIILGRIMSGLSDSDLKTLAHAMIKAANKHQITVANTLLTLDKIPTAHALDALEAGFLTSGKPRSTNSFPVKAVKLAFPAALEIVSLLIERVSLARDSRLARAAFEKTRALHDFAQLFLQQYKARKADMAVLEFEDLIRKTEALLRVSETAQWVLYRLDGGIDHILVDEAQDTSPLQWRIISALAEEIYASADTDRPRTVFVVGDEKQSIFSFQGADPSEFAKMRALFQTQLLARGTELAQGALLHSFRSAAPILQLVDTVFQGDMAQGLEGAITHLPTSNTRAGRVEIWPLLVPAEKPEPKKWFEPVDALPPGDPMVELAENIAKRVAGLINSGHELPGKNRAVRAGDFLILVQSRKVIFHAVIKALKAHLVPVAGSDRLKIAEELAVKDLLAVLQFATAPQDDLSLACALRSPLIGMSEAALFKTAYGRQGSLWRAVQGQGHAMLHDILGRADFDRPYELLERILIRHKGRQNLLARLGPEAEDGIDELLRQALLFENTANPSLTGFLEWISAEEIEIKRRLDDNSDQVRVMTVHGAKGLEAPIVILPQTVKKPNNTGAMVVPLGAAAAIGLPKNMAPAKLQYVIDQKQQQQSEEKNRLLYVALTRAESWLIVAGTGDPKKADADWYGQIRDAALGLGAVEDSAARLILENRWSDAKLPMAKSVANLPDLPDWLQAPAKTPQPRPKPKNPSDLAGGHSLADAVIDETALLRGSQTHLLLEKLVGIPHDAQLAAAQNLLGDEALPDVIAQSLAVLRAPELATVFAPDTLREVAISADIPDFGPIFGRIDALIVADEITAIDFKTNPLVPATPQQTPEGILRQLGAYHAALAQIWPDRVIKTAICWTSCAQLMEIPEKLCIAALHRTPKT